MALSNDEILQRATDVMPGVLEDLTKLVAHASVSFPGFPAEPVHAAAAEAVRIAREYGFENVRLLDIPGGYPAVWAEKPAAPGAPTVLLYGHYDVQPAPLEEQTWDTDPWELTRGADGRCYGRGAADNKSGVMIHAGAMKVLGGQLGVGYKLVLEGEEETLSHLEDLVNANPGLFRADVMVIADMGNLAAGEPSVTTDLRGDCNCTIEVSTLEHAVHSGIFGGPAPDALAALIKTLASLWDDNGNTMVMGLDSFAWQGAEYPEDEFRRQAGMLDGVDLIGKGSIATKLWSKPSATVIGLDAPDVDVAGNILIPSAKARVSMRIAPGQDPDAALDRLAEYLEDHVPWGAKVEVVKVKAAPAFRSPKGGPAMAAAKAALAAAYGAPASEVGSGGSIPLLASLQAAAPDAEFILWGAEDVAGSRIHGPNESVDPREIERLIAAEAMLLQSLGASS